MPSKSLHKVFLRFDLVIDPICFKTDLDFMMINILTKFHELLIKTVPSRVYIKLFPY